MAPIFVLVSVFAAIDLLAGGWFYYNSKPENGYELDYKLYMEGKLYWWQVRNDETGFLKRLERCKNVSMTCNWWTCALCLAEYFKTIVNFHAIAVLKIILNFLHQHFSYLAIASFFSVASIMSVYCVDKTIARRVISYIKFSNNPDSKESPPMDKARVHPNTDQPSKTSDPSYPYKPNISKKSLSMHKADLTKNREQGQPRKTTSNNA